MNRLINVRESRAVAIKHLVELSVEHEFFCHFFSKRKTCHVLVFVQTSSRYFFSFNLILKSDYINFNCEYSILHACFVKGDFEVVKQDIGAF